MESSAASRNSRTSVHFLDDQVLAINSRIDSFHNTLEKALRRRGPLAERPSEATQKSSKSSQTPTWSLPEETLPCGMQGRVGTARSGMVKRRAYGHRPGGIAWPAVTRPRRGTGVSGMQIIEQDQGTSVACGRRKERPRRRTRGPREGSAKMKKKMMQENATLL